MIFNVSLEKLIISILPTEQYKKISKVYKNIEDYNYINKTDDFNSICITKSKINLSSLSTNRTQLLSITYYKDEKNKKYYFIFKPYFEEDEFNELDKHQYNKKNKTYYSFNYYIQEYEEIDENMTVFRCTSIIDFKGLFNKIITSTLKKSFIKQFGNELKKFNYHIENNKYNKIDDCINELSKDGMGKLILECFDKKINKNNN